MCVYIYTCKKVVTTCLESMTFCKITTLLHRLVVVQAYCVLFREEIFIVTFIYNRENKMFIFVLHIILYQMKLIFSSMLLEYQLSIKLTPYD